MTRLSSCPRTIKRCCVRTDLRIFSSPAGWARAVCVFSIVMLGGQSLQAQDTNSETPKIQQPQDTTFDDLNFEMEKGGKFERSMLTEKINQLNGQKIRLRGFIKPAYKQTGITKFVFVRDNQECCFGPGAALYDCLLVELKKDESTDFTVRPITVVGEFFLKEFKGPDGNLWAIYRMKDAIVE